MIVEERFTRSQIVTALHKSAGDTLRTANIVRFRDLLESADSRTYDYPKITDELIGKNVHVEMYCTAHNPEKGYLMGCYKEVTGTVKSIDSTGNVRFIIFEDGKVLDPWSGTDIKIEVLE